MDALKIRDKIVSCNVADVRKFSEDSGNFVGYSVVNSCKNSGRLGTKKGTILPRTYKCIRKIYGRN